MPSFRIWSPADIVNISPDATAAASAVVKCAWWFNSVLLLTVNLSTGTVVRRGLTTFGGWIVPTTSLFRFRVLEVVLASTFTLVFLLEALGLSCPCVPEDVAISPLLLSPADVMSSVRPPLSSVLGAVSSSCQSQRYFGCLSQSPYHLLLTFDPFIPVLTR